MKCIFLDFDGVINNFDNGLHGVSYINALVLKQIVDLTGAKVIVTSSNKNRIQTDESFDYNRSAFYKDYIRVLEKLGINVYSLTPYVNSNRSLEIKKYLSDHNVDEYVILDDDLVDSDLQDHQILVYSAFGLQELHIEQALRILDGDLGFYPPEFDRDKTPGEICTLNNNYYNRLSKVKINQN